MTDGSEMERCVVVAVSFLSNAITKGCVRAPVKSDDESLNREKPKLLLSNIIFYTETKAAYDNNITTKSSSADSIKKQLQSLYNNKKCTKPLKLTSKLYLNMINLK